MTLEDLRYYQNYSFGLNQRMLRMIGLWPYQNPKLQIFLYVVLNLVFGTGCLLETYEFYKTDHNLETIINYLQLCLPATCSFICYNIAIINPEMMMAFYDRIEYDIVKMENEQELIILRKYTNNSRKITLILTFSMYAYYVLMIIPSIFNATFLFSGTMNDTRIVLPLSGEDLVKTKMQYYGLLLYQFIVAFVVITVIAAIYTSYMSLIQHACLLLAIVILKINTTFVDDLYDNQFLDYDTSNVGKEWIIDIVKSYVNAVEFVKLMNILSEKVYLVEVAGAMLLLILSFLYLSDMYLLKYKDAAEIAKSTIYSVTTIFLVYVNCYIGQTLIDHNLAISTELRKISFYKFSSKTRKLLPLVILQCSRPCGLMIGGLFVSSHEFFSRLIQNSLSYAMVCRTMR